jgi:DNA-binding transcriptional LysR family regulator
MLDYRMQTFLVLCETGNFTRTSEKIGITQPAVSQHIRALENYYGVKLFQISGKKTELTPAGRLLKAAAQTFQNDEKNLMAQMKAPEKISHPVNIGATVTAGEFVLAKPLAGYLKHHPEQTVNVTIANTAELIRRLKSGDIHFALIEGDYNRKIYGHMLYSTEHFIPVASFAHHFGKEPSELKDLFSEKLILREQGSGTREILEKSLSAENYSLSDFSAQISVNSIYAIIQLVLEDAGISFLYETAVLNGLRNKSLQCIPLKDFNVFHDLTFIWDKASLYAETYEGICAELKGTDLKGQK